MKETTQDMKTEIETIRKHKPRELQKWKFKKNEQNSQGWNRESQVLQIHKRKQTHWSKKSLNLTKA